MSIVASYPTITMTMTRVDALLEAHADVIDVTGKDEMTPARLLLAGIERKLTVAELALGLKHGASGPQNWRSRMHGIATGLVSGICSAARRAEIAAYLGDLETAVERGTRLYVLVLKANHGVIP
jgi:hypothetical protein